MDPFKVLGVSENATEAEIKAAYKALAKKYHPDNYADNPLSDLALEKMKEINTAYDEAMKRVRGASSGGSTGGRTAYDQVRVDIHAGRLDKADAFLDSVKSTDRNAEWHFLKGSILYKRGWYSEAFKYFAQANNMEPNNAEYRMAFQNAQRATAANRGYDPYSNVYSSPRSSAQCSTCDICQGLICADCCCECLGGDLIRCC